MHAFFINAEWAVKCWSYKEIVSIVDSLFGIRVVLSLFHIYERMVWLWHLVPKYPRKHLQRPEESRPKLLPLPRRTSLPEGHSSREQSGPRAPRSQTQPTCLRASPM